MNLDADLAVWPWVRFLRCWRSTADIAVSRWSSWSADGPRAAVFHLTANRGADPAYFSR